MTKIKILLIDDNEDDRILYQRLLSRVDGVGYHVTEISEANDAWEICQQDRPDCIILDYEMPGMNGMEFLGQLKQHKKMANIPLLMLTGQGSEQLAAQAIKLGALDYLIKSQMTSDTLHQSIVKMIEKGSLLVTVDAQRKELEKLAKNDYLTGLLNH